MTDSVFTLAILVITITVLSIGCIITKILGNIRFKESLRNWNDAPTHDEVDDEWLLKYEPLILEERRISPQRIIVTIKHRQDINSQSPVMTENDSAE